MADSNFATNSRAITSRQQNGSAHSGKLASTGAFITKILVVDDMAIIRDPIAMVLKGAGYSALCASTGAEAIKLIQSELPDLVLLDVHLPDISGLQVLQTARFIPATSRIPVILLSSDERRDCILEAANLGIQGYLIKSQFSLKELLARISDQLNKGGERIIQSNAANAAGNASASLSSRIVERTSGSGTGVTVQTHLAKRLTPA